MYEVIEDCLKDMLKELKDPAANCCGNTELNDHDVERGVCHSCYAAEVTAGDTW